MYDNIGGKIKGLAKAIFIIEAIATVIIGFVILGNAYYEEEIIVGVLVMLFGPVVAYLSSWLLYGFGELIDKTCDIADNTRGGERKAETQEKAEETITMQKEDDIPLSTIATHTPRISNTDVNIIV